MKPLPGSVKALGLATFSGAFCEIALKIAVFVELSKLGAPFIDKVLLFLALAVIPVLPSIFLSPFVGVIADKYPKAWVIRFAKLFEFIFALLGAVAIAEERIYTALFAALLMGISSAIFVPSKFAILPEILSSRDLSRGNGCVISAKYFALLVGVATVSGLALLGKDINLYLSACLSAVAAVGFLASFMISSVPAEAIQERLSLQLMIGRIKAGFLEIKSNRQVYLTMCSFAYFLLIGTVFQLNTIMYFEQAAGIGRPGVVVLLCVLSLGIALGALVADIVSVGKTEIGLVPVGTLGVALCLILMPLFISHYVVLALLFFISGVCGGASVVPLYAYFQQCSPVGQRGAYQGVSHAFSQACVLLGSAILVAGEFFLRPGPSFVFVVSGLVTLGVGTLALRLMPIALVKAVNFIFTNTVYRIRSYGLENVPERGGALIVCNHISYFDPLLISAAVPRSVRFLISRRLFGHTVLGTILRAIRAIPVSAHDKPKALVAALKEAREALQKGQVVCVFAEGEPSRIGHMLPFNRGLEFILKGVNVPVIPMYIDQTWGSLFDFRDGKYHLKMPKEIPYPASLTFGKPLLPGVRAFEARQAIAELGVDAFTNRRREHQLLHLGFIREAKAHPFKICMVESGGKKLSYLRALVGAFLFSDHLKGVLSKEENHVGVYLPPCIGSVLSNVALIMQGRVPINLNYTVSKEASESAISQGKIKHVITSRQFLTKVPSLDKVEYLYAEDVLPTITKAKRIRTLLKVLLLPQWILRRFVSVPQNAAAEVATIVFSSGSTGIPKGVMLTHANISSNVESMYNNLGMSGRDKVVGVLPFFHSFGYATGLWLPLLGGIGACYHFSPLDAEVVGEMVKREKATILLGTPSFLLSYIRRIPADHFKSIRWTIVGAEKLRPRVAAAFTEKFGKIPLEGYGCTELSPVAMINVPDIKEPTRDQIGHKPGTVGHPMPGQAVKVVHPDTHAPLQPGEMGLLLVKGPNVMKGYLDQPEKTAEVIWDGWYVTGDLASIDEDGFVTLHDRLSRFSKIAGEMVPHGGVEEAIQKILGNTEQVIVVTSLPDERKGERLVVLYVCELEPRAIIKQLADAGLPNLWIPKSEDFHKVDKIPALGSGKLDLQGARQIAKSFE